MKNETLPRFKNPPLIETVLGVQFERLPKLRNGHLGAFWKTLGPEWNKLNDAPPLELRSEVFGKAKLLSGLLHLNFSQDIALRLQIKNETEDRMIQLQNGRFHFNWLGQSGKQYPSYAEVWKQFDQHLQKFAHFLAEQKLGEIQPSLWEVTYVNHIPKDTVWNAPEDWGNVLRLGFPPYRAGGSSLESVAAEWHYVIPPEQGRLYIKIQHGELEGQEKLLLTLTARGSMTTQDNLGERLDIGHRTLVLAFKEITSQHAHEYWGLSND